MPKRLLNLTSLVLIFFATSINGVALAVSDGSVIQVSVCGKLPTPTISTEKIKAQSHSQFQIPGSAGGARARVDLYINSKMVDRVYSNSQGNFIFTDKLPLGKSILGVKTHDNCNHDAVSTDYTYINSPKKSNIIKSGSIIFLIFLIITILLFMWFVIWRRKLKQNEENTKPN